MLVDINLLPKKESKNIKLIVIFSAALLLVLVVGFWLFWQGNEYKNEIASLDQQIATTQQIVQIEQEKVVDGLASDSVSKLETAVTWASEDPLKTVPIIKHVTSLLPERGFIQNISYAESGNINLSVQFDTSKEAAYYLKHLLDSEWFSEVVLSAVSANAPESEAASDETEQDTTEKADGEASDDESETATEEKKDSKEQKKKNDEIVPRYVGQFQLTLSRDYIKSQEQKQAATEGGKES
ncbi:hypothetical protein M3181_12955 [Mesobacillus maritimus]|uniref:PilN domain-containing protein n=1 Tax=Mesobacillus maritimus TaxID=1643336 RepID=UPI00203B66FA|nr:hypothetical protein [Mesobacillus maritimus]MCM3669909.1 hypothetical protein [Mesobacillus maritimus]